MNPSPPPHVLFIDDGGVMNDNSIRAPQWQQLCGEFLAPRLGGRPEQWAEANGSAQVAQLWTGTGFHRRPMESFATLYREYQLSWMRVMCEYVGVPVPPDDEALALEREVSDYVTARVRSAIPGAVDAIRALHDADFTLHTASGEISSELDNYLAGMGVRKCFGYLFGSDVVDVWKGSAEYYRRVFTHAGVDAADVLVVDDNAEPCRWAAEAGARTVRIASDAEGPNTAPSLAALAERLLDGR
jgi:HAD superfamily hydrolase (TIGR01509 family)